MSILTFLFDPSFSGTTISNHAISGPSFSGPVISCPDTWSVIFSSVIFGRPLLIGPVSKYRIFIPDPALLDI